MKKSYLLAGSISVLGVLGGGLSVQAFEGSDLTATAINSGASQPLTAATTAPKDSTAAALVAHKPESAISATEISRVVASSVPTAPLLLAQTPITSVGNVVSPGQSTTAQSVTPISNLVLEVEQNSAGQVSSVSQLSDVQPTDWAFQALQSLVERYGCIAGYPDGTFRGNRAATRYELAAALNACLDVISDRFATKEDLAVLRKLQEEFAAELATLRGRVDALEARTAKLEAQQFSTTTKLQGVATMAFQFGRYSGGDFANSAVLNSGFDTNGKPLLIRGDKLNPTVIAATILSLNTSFSGSDLLQTSLAAGNNGADAIGTAFLGTTRNLSGGTGSVPGTPGPFFNPGYYYWSGFSQNFFLYRLAYTFKPIKDVTITAGPQFYPSDIVDFNSFANAPASDFGSYFFINNPFIVPFALNYSGGAGIAVQWNPKQGPFTLKALYMAGAAGSTTRVPGGEGDPIFRGGFAGEPFQSTFEFQYADTFSGGKNNIAARLQFTNSRTFGVGSNALGLNFELGLGKFGIFGRAGYAFINSTSEAGLGNIPFSPIPYSFPFSGFVPDRNFKAVTFMGGVAYKDLFVPGSLAAVAVGAPFITQDSGLPNNVRGLNDENQLNVEAFYRFPVNDNISVTPIFSAIFNPNNSSFNPTIYQGVLRTTFTF